MLKISGTYNKLCRKRFFQAVRDFHESADTEEINKQLRGEPATVILTLLIVEYEFKERAIVAGLLFQPIDFKDVRIRVKFIRNMAKLCHQQETRRPGAPKRKTD